MFKPLRIGYVHTELSGDRLRSDDALMRELRRGGFMVTWRSFSDAVTAVRALHNDEVDIALGVARHDVMRAGAAGHIETAIGRADHGTADQARDVTQSPVHRYTLTTEEVIDQSRDGLLSVMRAEARTSEPDSGKSLSHTLIAPSAPDSAPARTLSETWICTDASPASSGHLVIMALDGTLTIEQASNITQFRVLENNPYALIAEDHSGELDTLLNKMNVALSMVSIDKISSRFTYTTALSSGVWQRSGLCRGFGEGSENVLSQAQ